MLDWLEHRVQCRFVVPNEDAANALPDAAVTWNYMKWSGTHADLFDVGLCVLSNEHWDSLFGEEVRRRTFLHMALHGRPYPSILNTWSHQNPKQRSGSGVSGLTSD